MSSDIEVGQVLSMKIRFNNNGDISTKNHPYLVVGVNDDMNVVEVVQIDSLQGKEYKGFYKSNKILYQTNPIEAVIDKDSFVQLDNKIKIENFNELEQFRQQPNKLSPIKLADILSAYRFYHQTYEIDEMKNVYMDKSEILEINT